jgi:hypothetical protein
VKNNDAVLSPMAQPERDTELPECHCKNHSGITLISISRRPFRQLQTLIYRPETIRPRPNRRRKAVTIKVTIHDGELKHYEVDVECKTRDSRIQKAYNGTTSGSFATLRNPAGPSACAVGQPGGLSPIAPATSNDIRRDPPRLI